MKVNGGGHTERWAVMLRMERGRRAWKLDQGMLTLVILKKAQKYQKIE